ncbi:STAS-domain containing protein [Andreprevotia sp. IGB-42]|uniref:STAS domain-containing protein n=1 Tax=Andreprevotia sp. IGB-42 TaxID=2497473 RepID=UPI00135A4771|nr:STAS domain-containing protein [Andreprevotia sp. IGB-42]KAF0814450.1 STAS-domain containing protein [Andreprevotia sp. IGB-42]
MTPTVQIEEEVGRVVLSGQFDFSAHREFRQVCETLIANSSVREVLIDFQNVNYLDSSALGMLLLLKEKIGAANKSLALVNCRDTVKQVLEIACFGKIFTIR